MIVPRQQHGLAYFNSSDSKGGVSTFFGNFISVRRLIVRFYERRLQRRVKRSSFLAKSHAARRQKHLELLKLHTSQNVQNLKIAEQCLVAGNLEDAKTQWKKLKRMKFPANKHSAAHLGNKRKLLKMVLERVEEENEAETTTPRQISLVSPELA